jgi:hypothetical protein
MYGLLIVLVIVATSVWVLIDAHAIGAVRDKSLGMAGTSPAAWFVGSLLVWIIVFPMYLLHRPAIKSAAEARKLVPSNPAMPPAGWYDNPERPGTQRWWDGSAWGPVAPS